MYGPGRPWRASMRRHWVITISSWSHVVLASGPARATRQAAWSRTAATSARCRLILLSRVMTTQPWLATAGIQTGSGVDGAVIGHAGRRRFLTAAPGSPG